MADVSAETLVQIVEGELQAIASDSFFDVLVRQALIDRLLFYKTFQQWEEFSVQAFLDFYRGDGWVQAAQVVAQLAEFPVGLCEVWSGLDASGKSQMSVAVNNMLTEHQHQIGGSVTKQIEVVLSRLM